MLTRREMVKMGLLAGAAAALPWEITVHATPRSAAAPFAVPLRVPPVLRPARRDATTDYYDLTMRSQGVEILPGRRTQIWGYGGQFPGPTIRAERGRRVVVRQRNGLRVPTSVHNHGAHVSAGSDGHPTDLIRPGRRKEYTYPNDQLPATLWYHDHANHATSRNVYMGLAGFYLIDDPFERNLNLPSGPFDVPLMIQDRDFRSNGSLLFRDSHNSVTGDTILVNGRPQPFLRVARRKYRFRFLNASNTRDYVLELSSGDPIVQIGSDGGLLAAPYPARSIELWPAERADTVIDFSRFPVGTRITLRNTSGEGSTASIMRFDVVASASDPSSLPATLRPIQRLSGARVRRQFRFSFNVRRGVWVINGKPFGGDRVDIQPRRGVPEIWTLVNNSGMGHPFHMHRAQGLILDRDGRPPHPGERGWKDTFRVDPGERVRFITRFDDYLGRFVYHCHNLAHEDHAMMGQMRVVG